MATQDSLPVSDFAGAGRAPSPMMTTTSPPAVKLTRELGSTLQNIAVIAAATVGLMTQRLEPGWFALLVVLVLRNRQGITEQALIELFRGRLP